MYLLTSQGLGQAAPCEPAAPDLERQKTSVTFLNNALLRKPLNQRRVALRKELVGSDVDNIIQSLDAYIKAGCCEPTLKDLETQLSKLPWPTVVKQQHRKLIDAIQSAQAKAKKDYKHC